MPGEVKFHLIKAPDYREILVDGGFGGIQPSGRIGLAVYTERTPIPRAQVQELSDEGTLGEELRERRESRDGLIRYVQAFLYMDYVAAKAIHQWLGERLATIEGASNGEDKRNVR